jgi:hypothetical protein
MCIFLLPLNRALIHMRDCKTKSTIILVVFLAMMGGSATLRLLLYRHPFLAQLWSLPYMQEDSTADHFVVNGTQLFVFERNWRFQSAVQAIL